MGLGSEALGLLVAYANFSLKPPDLRKHFVGHHSAAGIHEQHAVKTDGNGNVAACAGDHINRTADMQGLEIVFRILLRV